ncbi:hypothetical protein FQA39_LY02285 [Lamprigera yunnana]|nr:hypothetical protein FQA39_LY02285 [Lamprigera yunnana]
MELVENATNEFTTNFCKLTEDKILIENKNTFDSDIDKEDNSTNFNAVTVIDVNQEIVTELIEVSKFKFREVCWDKFTTGFVNGQLSEILHSSSTDNEIIGTYASENTGSKNRISGDENYASPQSKKVMFYGGNDKAC